MRETRRFAIRQMAPEDAAAVAHLTSQLGYPSTEADIKRRYVLIQDRADGQLIVALDIDAAVIGWIHVQALALLEADQRAEIWGLVVADTVRGSGVGRLLVKAAEEWAVRRGLDTMGVRSNIVRVEAHGFYEHLGYEVVKTQKAYRKNLKSEIL